MTDTCFHDNIMSSWPGVFSSMQEGAAQGISRAARGSSAPGGEQKGPVHTDELTCFCEMPLRSTSDMRKPRCRKAKRLSQSHR